MFLPLLHPFLSQSFFLILLLTLYLLVPPSHAPSLSSTFISFFLLSTFSSTSKTFWTVTLSYTLPLLSVHLFLSFSLSLYVSFCLNTMSDFTFDLLLISGFDPWSGTLNDIKPLIIFEDNHISTYYRSLYSKKLYTVRLSSSSFCILHIASDLFSPSSYTYLYDFYFEIHLRCNLFDIIYRHSITVFYFLLFLCTLFLLLHHDLDYFL